MKRILMTVAALGLALPAFAGKAVMEGSTTVLPIAQKAAEVFMNNNPGEEISVRGGGSGVGIASIIDGTCDIAIASRAMKPAELEKASKKGRDLKAHVIAMDAIANIVHPSNPLTNLTREQIKRIYTSRASNWKEFGGPDLRIVVISRDTASGTFEAFSDLVLDKKRVRPDAIMQASNQTIAGIVARTPGAIGYVGLGYLTSAVKAIGVDGVMPTRDNVLKNKYRISRPLFMYTKGKPEGTVKKYIDFLKSPAGQKIVNEEGFIGLN